MRYVFIGGRCIRNSSVIHSVYLDSKAISDFEAVANALSWSQERDINPFDYVDIWDTKEDCLVCTLKL